MITEYRASMVMFCQMVFSSFMLINRKLDFPQIEGDNQTSHSATVYKIAVQYKLNIVCLGYDLILHHVTRQLVISVCVSLGCQCCLIVTIRLKKCHVVVKRSSSQNDSQNLFKTRFLKCKKAWRRTYSCFHI